MSPLVGVVGGLAVKDLDRCRYVGGQAQEGDERGLFQVMKCVEILEQIMGEFLYNNRNV